MRRVHVSYVRTRQELGRGSYGKAGMRESLAIRYVIVRSRLLPRRRTRVEETVHVVGYVWSTLAAHGMVRISSGAVVHRLGP
jgi:hypothetical protein